MENISQESLELLESIMDSIIPKNNESLLVEDTSSRFSGAAWFNAIQQQTVVLAGLGGIGSWTALLLSRLQIAFLHLVDMDNVEYANISGQFYSNDNIDKNKAVATTENIKKFSNYYHYITYGEAFTVNTNLSSDIMICGFDNMVARKGFFKVWLNRVRNSIDKSKLLFIDGRLEAEQFQIIAITGDNESAIKRYQNEFLFDDSEVEEVPCNYKQTSFMANMIASYITNIFVNFVANTENPIFPREVPFFTNYSADIMYLKVES